MLNTTFKLNALNLEIIDGAHVSLDTSWHHENVCDPFSRLYFIKSGEGFLRYKNGETILSGGNIYLIPAEFNFSYGCKSLEKIYFHVSLSSVDQYDFLSCIKRICSAKITDAETDEIFSCFSSDNYRDILRLKSVLYDIIFKFYDKFNTNDMMIKPYSDTVNNVLKYIHENAKINLSVKAVADSLFISESKIRKTFKQETGTPIGKYIDDFVLSESKKLLRKENMTIREISTTLGFCDQFYFSRRFKEKYFKTPSEYRREKTI